MNAANKSNKTTAATPTPIPAFAPVESPCGGSDEGVGVGADVEVLLDGSVDGVEDDDSLGSEDVDITLWLVAVSLVVVGGGGGGVSLVPDVEELDAEKMTVGPMIEAEASVDAAVVGEASEGGSDDDTGSSVTVRNPKVDSEGASAIFPYESSRLGL